ncbi:hypothetical protein ACFX1X_044656 [Malus domestica]
MSRDRSELDLGLPPLDTAITELQYLRDPDNPYARPLLVIIQMISEAAKFSTFEERIANAIQRGSNYRPQPDMLVAQNNWDRLSQDIQGSEENGMFANAFEPRYGGEIMFRVDSVRQLRDHIALGLLLYTFQNRGRNFQNQGRGRG